MLSLAVKLTQSELELVLELPGDGRVFGDGDPLRSERVAKRRRSCTGDWRTLPLECRQANDGNCPNIQDDKHECTLKQL
jgi:hypothetical protein